MRNVHVCIAKLENEGSCRKADAVSKRVGGEGLGGQTICRHSVGPRSTVLLTKYSEQAAAREYNENNRNNQTKQKA